MSAQETWIDELVETFSESEACAAVLELTATAGRQEARWCTNCAMETRSARKLLNEERTITVARMHSMESEFDDIAASAFDSNLDDEHDPEGSTIAFERARASALLSEARESLLAIDAALAKIADGHYGECENCCATIARERLLALPTARLCIDCAASSK